MKMKVKVEGGGGAEHVYSLMRDAKLSSFGGRDLILFLKTYIDFALVNSFGMELHHLLSFGKDV